MTVHIYQTGLMIRNIKNTGMIRNNRYTGMIRNIRYAGMIRNNTFYEVVGPTLIRHDNFIINKVNSP